MGQRQNRGYNQDLPKVEAADLLGQVKSQWRPTVDSTYGYGNPQRETLGSGTKVSHGREFSVFPMLADP
jgi:hypothetical protein